MIEEIVIYGIAGGTAGLGLGNILSYTYRKKEIINNKVRGIEPEPVKQAYYTPSLIKIFDAGEYLAEKRYEEGKYDDIIKEYQKKF